MIENQVKDYYNKISKQYDEHRFSRAYYRRIAEIESEFVLSKVRGGGSVLEIGPGTGRFSAQMVHKASHVTAIDISQNMLDQLHLKVPAQNLSTQCLSIYELATLPGYGDFDAVICMRVLPHLENPLLALELMSGAVNPKGDVVFDFWNLNSYVGLVRWLFRRPSFVYTKYYTYPAMLSLIDQSGLKVNDVFAWGYPRLGKYSLDKPGNNFFKSLGYSLVFHGNRK